MRVALDVTPAVRQRAGIGRYTRELAVALLARARHDYRLFVADRHPGGDALSWSGSTPVVAAGVPARWLNLAWHRLGLGIAAERWTGPLDLFHATDFLAPPLRQARAVVTVHDLSFLRHPECAEPALARYLARAVPRAVLRAAHLLADSENTRRDLGALLGVAAERVSVAYPGVGPRFRRVTDGEVLARLSRSYGLTRPFVLGVGTLEPRKDWPVLIEAFRALGQDRPEIELVIAGGRGWQFDPILDAASAAGRAVRLLGFVPDEDLPALLSQARAFAYPSRYEGFGLPALEALACGVPSVVAASSSLPEVVGDAALLVPAGDERALREALERLLDDEALRAELARRGPARAAQFSWDRCAVAVEAAYELALASHDRRAAP